jgi:hypothetical protein
MGFGSRGCFPEKIHIMGLTLWFFLIVPLSMKFKELCRAQLGTPISI